MLQVVSRQHYDSRSVYPKLMYDPALTTPSGGGGGLIAGNSGSFAMRLPPGSHPPTGTANPLRRAVNLTLGVALLGSLIGGVQLYGMIGMHGLLRADPRDIPDPWYGYQVALRVLEVMICYLLAVVATTPLRQDSGQHFAILLKLPVPVFICYRFLKIQCWRIRSILTGSGSNL
jgi:hypothetical protein